MKRLSIFILMLVGILSIGSIKIYAFEDNYQTNSIELVETEPEVTEPYLTDNEKTELLVTLVIYIVALFLGILTKSKLLISLTGLLWLIPLVTINSLIIKLFSVIMLIISFMILLKERDEYYD